MIVCLAWVSGYGMISGMGRILGIFIGGLIALVLLAVPVIMFGGAIVAGLFALMAIPIGFPLTTMAVIGLLVGAFVIYRVRRHFQRPK